MGMCDIGDIAIVRVFIATANYGTLFIDLSTGDGVQRLAAVIEQRTGICPNYQRLLFNKQQVLNCHVCCSKEYIPAILFVLASST